MFFTTYKPFSMPLEAFGLKFLDSYNHTTSWFTSILIYPSFKDVTKTSFAKTTISSEVPSCIFQFIVGKWLEVTWNKWIICAKTVVKWVIIRMQLFLFHTVWRARIRIWNRNWFSWARILVYESLLFMSLHLSFSSTTSNVHFLFSCKFLTRLKKSKQIL